MKKSILRIVSLILALILVTGAFTACGDGGNDAETTTAQETEATSEDGITEEPGTEDGVSEDATGETTTAAGAEDTTAKTPDSYTNAEILAIYTEIMDKAKTEQPAYKKYEYQEIPSDAQNRTIMQGNAYVGRILDLVDTLNLITPKADAIANPEVKEKNSGMGSFPVNKTNKGCLLTDASVIKEATYETLANGNAKITIALKDEKKPEPAPEGATSAPSYTGAMFAPLSSADINETLNGGIVSAVVSNVTYDLTYHDCKATVEYNPVTKQIVNLEQIMIVTIYGNCKVLFLFPVELTQELYNTTYFYELTY